jgi:hypothetical protein
MEKVVYMTPEEIRNLDRSKIYSMQMTSGDVFLITHEKEETQLNQQKEGCPCNEKTSEIRLRARKGEEKEETEEKPEEKTEEKPEEKTEEKKEETAEEKVEIDIEGQPQEENDKKEVLRGPDGKPLLNEMLVYGGMTYDNQEQANDNNVNLYPIPQHYEPIVQPNMPGTKNTEYQPQPQPQPEPQPPAQTQTTTEINNVQNNIASNFDYNNTQEQTQYYPTQEINNQPYPPTDINNQNMQVPYEDPNAYNQTIPQQPQENIPVQDINVPNIPPQQQENIPVQDINIPQTQQNEPYPQYDPNMDQYQNKEYPEFEEQNNSTPYTSPQQPQYQPPQPEPAYPPVQPNTQPQIQPQVQPPVQPQAQPQAYPKMQPPMQPQAYPKMQPPMHPQGYPKMVPPTKPPMHHPPRMVHPMQPPMHHHMKPPMYNPQMQYHVPGYGMAGKRILPKQPVIQINVGMGGYGPHVGLMPHGPKHLIPGRRNIVNPVTEFIDFVSNPVGYMVEKSLGLRSNKPKTEKKEGEVEEENKEAKKEENKEENKEEKEEKKEITQENVKEEQKEVVLRARKKETEEHEQPEFEEVEYAEEIEQTQEQVQEPEKEQVQTEIVNQEVICPECTGENLCPECTGENLCQECKKENLCQECKEEKVCPECSNINKVEVSEEKKNAGKTVRLKNFNFHEIVETSNCEKSHVVVKKEGVIISGK